MTGFDELSEVRNLARAQAVEDFEYFANTVLGARLDASTCEHIQRCIERNELISLDVRTQSALDAWLCVIGKNPGPLPQNDTVQWLFGRAA